MAKQIATSFEGGAVFIGDGVHCIADLAKTVLCRPAGCR